MTWTNSPADLIESAWGLLANAGGGDWETETPEWRKWAATWRDRYHSYLDEVGPPRLEEASK